jgi:protein-disulfide isomerase
MNRYAAGLIVAMVIPIALSAADESPITRQQADDILRELQQIRNLLQQPTVAGNGVRPPTAIPRNISLALEKTRFIGSESAPLTIVEFTDYQCPYCQRFHLTTFSALKEKYIETGIARFYSRDLPLGMHKNALRAAQAGRCADDQRRFWEMRNLLQSNPERLEVENLVQYARELKLDADQFQLCVTNEKYRAAVESDATQAMQIGANGTPTFLVGTSTRDGVEGQLMMGALPFEAFEQRLLELRSE